VPTALADAPQTQAPTAKQKTAILKAWAQGGQLGPSKCYRVTLAKPQKYQPLWAGVVFNDKASGCLKYAFDGAALLYGTGNHFYLLTEASAMDANECKATALVLGPVAWGNLVDAGIAALGCENID
jgi:hypothetical protein